MSIARNRAKLFASIDQADIEKTKLQSIQLSLSGVDDAAVQSIVLAEIHDQALAVAPPDTDWDTNIEEYVCGQSHTSTVTKINEEMGNFLYRLVLDIIKNLGCEHLTPNRLTIIKANEGALHGLCRLEITCVYISETELEIVAAYLREGLLKVIDCDLPTDHTPLHSLRIQSYEHDRITETLDRLALDFLTNHAEQNINAPLEIKLYGEMHVVCSRLRPPPPSKEHTVEVTVLGLIDSFCHSSSTISIEIVQGGAHIGKKKKLSVTFSHSQSSTPLIEILSTQKSTAFVLRAKRSATGKLSKWVLAEYGEHKDHSADGPGTIDLL